MAHRKKKPGKERATFTLFGGREQNPVGSATFFGKSYKKAKAAGTRYLRKMGLGSGTQQSGARSQKPRKTRRRKKNVNFGQRMARLRASKRRSFQRNRRVSRRR